MLVILPLEMDHVPMNLNRTSEFLGSFHLRASKNFCRDMGGIFNFEEVSSLDENIE